MPDTLDLVRAHYGADGLTARIQAALAKIADETSRLSPAQLAPLDQFHTRGMPATAELAGAAQLDASTRVLDLGSGVGGPARYIAATFGCRVVGLDLSESFVAAAEYLTQRTGLADKVSFQVGDALNPPFDPGAFDAVFLQHVAMNIQDRSALYAAVRRLLARGGRFVTHDVVLRAGEPIYPTPWARDPASSFLLSEADTRRHLEEAGFVAKLWRDETPAALAWADSFAAAPPASPLHLGIVMGPEFGQAAGNLIRNIREGRVGVLSAVLSVEA